MHVSEIVQIFPKRTEFGETWEGIYELLYFL